MAKTSRNSNQRKTRDWMSISRVAAARSGAIMTFALLVLTVNVMPVSGAAGFTTSLTESSVGMKSDILRAPLRQAANDVADLELPTESGSTSEASRMAAILDAVNRQGIQSAESLQRMAPIAVPNLMPEPEFVVNARIERAAAADAAATAAAIAAAEAALSVQATAEARAQAEAASKIAEAEAASKAVALAAIREAQAEADAAAAAMAAAETARANAAKVAAVLSAKQEAQVRAAEVAATQSVAALAAPMVVSEAKPPDQVSSLLIALAPMLGGVLGFRLWRIKQEPFVLKANPVSASAGAQS